MLLFDVITPKNQSTVVQKNVKLKFPVDLISIFPQILLFESNLPLNNTHFPAYCLDCGKVFL